MAKIPNPMDRSELIASLSDALRASPGSQTVKTRIIEAHAPERSPDGVDALLRSLGERAGFSVEEGQGSTWLLRDRDEGEFIVDALDPRFWLLHTTSSAQRIEQLVRVRLLSDARVDTAWIPGELLDALPGNRRFVKSSYESHKLFPSDSAPGGGTRRLTVRVEGNAPDELLELLRSDPRFAATAAVGAVGTHLSHPSLGEARVVADYQGRCASSGTSFEVALDAIWQLLDRYTDFINRLESSYRLAAPPGAAGGFSLQGRVATIVFPEPLSNLDGFLQALFSCREPFRLWAAYDRLDEDYWEANAVDLHVGQAIRLEGTRDRVHVFLSEQTCGNTLARLITNFQHHLDASLSLPEVGLATV